MINLYQSNMLDALLTLFLKVRKPSTDPLQPETILVPSTGMQRWLQLGLARKQGIAANLDFQLPGAFIWRQATRLLGLEKQTAFDKETMAWRIHALLPSIKVLEGTAVQANWNAATDVGRYELAWRIADVFDQYLIYRPDWLKAWEQGKILDLGIDEAWQAALWQQLSTGETMHRANAMLEFAARLKGGNIKGLPESLVLFGVSSLPPVQWEILSAIGQRSHLDVFLLNPSENYWGQLRRKDGPDSGHALLASLGQQGRDFINTVASSDIEEPVGSLAFVSPLEGGGSGSILAALQSDLCHQQVRDEEDRLPLMEDDHSLRVHVCHSALREVEVLHDQLLHAFENDDSLMPDDVLVMCTNIQRYAPLIDAVFGKYKENDDGYLPYSIADRQLTVEQPLLNRLVDLLSIPGSRFEIEAVIGLLEEPLLRQNFGLEETDLGTVRRWCEELHLRWGRDANDRLEKGLIADVPFTWGDALTRLQLGFAMPASEAGITLFEGYAPADAVFSGSQAKVLAGFSRFIETLLYWESRLQRGVRALDEWADEFDQLILAFFGEEAPNESEQDQENRKALLQIKVTLESLRQQAGLAKEADKQPYAVMRKWLMRHLQALESRRGFLQGRVTVCAMVPMRSLPFRFIAVLGMDDGVFPRQQKPWPFDLMEKVPRAGDRSRRQDDRYLFLETMLAARERLYLSYTGFSDTDGSIRPPSPVLSELLDHVRATIEPLDNKRFESIFYVKHFLQPFNPAYFSKGSGYFSFNKEFAMVSGLVSNKPQEEDKGLQSFRLPPADDNLLTLTPARIEQFLSHPVRFFLKERLGVQLPYDKGELESDEPIDIVDKKGLRQMMVNEANASINIAKASGFLPSGEWGNELFHNEATVMADFRQRIDELVPASASVESLSVSRKIDNVQIIGPVADIVENRIVRISLTDKVYASNVLCLYFIHLLANSEVGNTQDNAGITTTLLWLDGEISFDPIDKMLADDALQNIAKAVEEGMQKPLPFFRKSSLAYVKKEDMASAESAWRGGEFVTGDCQDVWNRLIWREQCPCDNEFAKWAVTLYRPILDKVKGL